MTLSHYPAARTKTAASPQTRIVLCDSVPFCSSASPGLPVLIRARLYAPDADRRYDLDLTLDEAREMRDGLDRAIKAREMPVAPSS